LLLLLISLRLSASKTDQKVADEIVSVFLVRETLGQETDY